MRQVPLTSARRPAAPEAAAGAGVSGSGWRRRRRGGGGAGLGRSERGGAAAGLSPVETPPRDTAAGTPRYLPPGESPWIQLRPCRSSARPARGGPGSGGEPGPVSPPSCPSGPLGRRKRRRRRRNGGAVAGTGARPKIHKNLLIPPFLTPNELYLGEK
ncbi:zinc finger protein 740 isoform X4 [Vidua chalybeata]|uniref:zinc finger protein 740 isoform X4 n=1 Tax=Vidua chalybeata TaxID=81927 RepID=UPI0023A906BA|nr:zinc finger protein 740 isoform X4 [Vidua chalybeata]